LAKKSFERGRNRYIFRAISRVISYLSPHFLLQICKTCKKSETSLTLIPLFLLPILTFFPIYISLILVVFGFVAILNSKKSEVGQSQLLLSLIFIGIASALVIATNSTINGNLTGMFTQLNTSQNASEIEVNQTNITFNRKNETLLPKIDLSLSFKNKITRGESFNFSVFAKNVGNSTAKNLKIIVDLPKGFSTDNLMKDCGDLEVNSTCEFSFSIISNLEASLGVNEIKVRANYE
jgi:hypothetical protein